MSYLIGFHWAWLLLSLVLGIVIGWSTYLRPRTRWMDGLVWIVAALIGLAALVAISTLIPGRPGYWLEVAVLMAAAYVIGCPIGWGLRHQAFRDPASAADHDSLLPKPGYVFPGGTLGGGDTIPAAIVATTAISESVRPAPDSTPLSSPAVAALVPQDVEPQDVEPQEAEPQEVEAPEVEANSVQPQLVEPAVAAPMTPAVASAPAVPAVSSDARPAPPTSAIAVEATPTASATAAEPAMSPAVPKGIRVMADPVPPELPPAVAPASPAATGPERPAETAVTPLATTAAGASAAATPEKAPPLPDEGRHAGVRPDGFVTARGNKADDLKRIKGIGPQNEGRLHGLGIWHFDQIAAWTPDNVKWVGSYLAFPGRIEREKWIDQAKALASGQDTEFSKRVAAGKVATSKDNGSQGQGNVEGSIKPRRR